MPLIGRVGRETCFSQSEALVRSGLWPVISMDISAFVCQTSFRRKTSGGIAHSVGCFLRLGRYVTIQFQDRRGAPVTETAPNHRCVNSINPYPIWFSLWCKSYPIKCTHRLTSQRPHFLLVHKETQTERNKETEQDKNFSLTGKTGWRLEW